MAKKSRQVQYLPAGWVWVSKGAEAWTTSQGKTSYEKHAKYTGAGPDAGKTLSVRQVQNRQGIARAQAGQPKPQAIRRTGKIRTIKGGGPQNKRSIDKTAGGTTGKSAGISLYSPAAHGQSQAYSFYDFASARSYAALQGIPLQYKNVILQIRYTERLVSTGRIGSDKLDKNGYATISTFGTAQFYNDSATSTEAKIGELDNPWILAEQNIQRYDMTGPNARVYISMSER